MQHHNIFDPLPLIDDNDRDGNLSHIQALIIETRLDELFMRQNCYKMRKSSCLHNARTTRNYKSFVIFWFD